MLSCYLQARDLVTMTSLSDMLPTVLNDPVGLVPQGRNLTLISASLFNGF